MNFLINKTPVIFYLFASQQAK